jgi:hypothetical protein
VTHTNTLFSLQSSSFNHSNTAVGVQIHHEEGVRSKECTAYMIDENSTDSESKRAYKDDYTDLESL